MTAFQNSAPSLLDLATAITTTAIVAVALWVALHGPTQPIPMHFDLSGNPDRWGDRTEMAWLLGFLALMLGVLGGGFGLAIQRSADASRRRSLKVGQFIVLITTAVITLLVGVSMLRTATTGETVETSWVMVGISILLVIVGGVMGRVGPNPIVGVRTPWAFKSRLAWDRSNRLAGRLMFGLGLAGLIAAPVLPAPLALPAMIGLIMVAAAWSAFESWRVWRTDPERQTF